MVTGASDPGFYIEVLLGGLMSGVLYSLVALGFVLIFKASGVFNFAQGAMVLFAALSVARMARGAAAMAGHAARSRASWWRSRSSIERLVLRPLVNQDPVVLLMATLGVTYFLNGFGQTVWGSDIYEINLGIAKEPVMILQSVFQGGILINKDDCRGGGGGGGAGRAVGAVLPENEDRARAARGGRRPPGGAVDRDSAEPHLGHRLVRWPAWWRWWRA